MKKILFITGTRADFGKLKSLIQKVHKNKNLHQIFKILYKLQKKKIIILIKMRIKK